MMLVTGMARGESVKIGDDIYITVLPKNSRSSKIRLGIQAPKAIPIIRLKNKRHFVKEDDRGENEMPSL
jgi:carbon storage regulator CsrA